MSDKKELKPNLKKEVSVSVKRGAIIIACLFPILIGLSVGFYFAGLSEWLSILLLVCFGALFYIVIDIIARKVSLKRLEKKEKEQKKYDPFAD